MKASEVPMSGRAIELAIPGPCCLPAFSAGREALDLIASIPAGAYGQNDWRPFPRHVDGSDAAISYLSCAQGKARHGGFGSCLRLPASWVLARVRCRSTVTSARGIHLRCTVRCCSRGHQEAVRIVHSRARIPCGGVGGAETPMIARSRPKLLKQFKSGVRLLLAL